MTGYNTLNREQPWGLLLLIDFEKAFDSLSWSFIQKALKFLNFGYSMCIWTKVFYGRISSEAMRKGNISSFFSISRGCRQGNPLSPYIFIMCAKFLSNKVRSNKSMKGIHINQSEHNMQMIHQCFLTAQNNN